MLTGIGYEFVNLWKVDSGEKSATLTGHRGWVKAVVFSPDGRTVRVGVRMTRSDSGTSRLPLHNARYGADSLFPAERPQHPTSIWTKVNTLLRNVQRFYANQMEINGFGRKTFTLKPMQMVGCLHTELRGSLETNITIRIRQTRSTMKSRLCLTRKNTSISSSQTSV